MRNADRNFIRITRSSIIVYPPVVKRFGLLPWCSVFFVYDCLGHDWVFFTPAGFSKHRRLNKVNPDSTLYAGVYTEPQKRGDYLVTDIELMRLPEYGNFKSFNGEMFIMYKVERIKKEDEK